MCTARPACMAVGEPAYDAASFARIFPHAKMLGFYAGGEIGPKALAAAPASRATQVGRAAMQGFTAVFGLFMVPQRTERAAPLAHADAAAVGAAYAAARAARTPPPPPAGTLSEAQLRQLPAKEARRAPASCPPRTRRTAAHPPRTHRALPCRPPRPPRPLRLWQPVAALGRREVGPTAPSRSAVAQDDGEPQPGVCVRHGQGRNHSRHRRGAGELAVHTMCTGKTQQHKSEVCLKGSGKMSHFLKTFQKGVKVK